VKVEVTGEEQLEALRKKMIRWTIVAPEEVKKALKTGAMMVQKEAQKEHFRKPKMPRGVGDPNNAWLGTASGDWRLRNSIVYRVAARQGEFSAAVGTNMWYARRHEFGTNGMPERPFLRPSLEKQRPNVFKHLEEKFFKSYGK